jgi:hypothetical protein
MLGADSVNIMANICKNNLPVMDQRGEKCQKTGGQGAFTPCPPVF